MSDSQDGSLNHNEELALSTYEHDLETRIDSNLSHGQDLYTQQLFNVFQNAATAVTKMFRGTNTCRTFLLPSSLSLCCCLERSSGTSNWNTFHAAAESVTMLYKGKSSRALGFPSGTRDKNRRLTFVWHLEQCSSYEWEGWLTAAFSGNDCFRGQNRDTAMLKITLISLSKFNNVVLTYVEREWLEWMSFP